MQPDERCCRTWHRSSTTAGVVAYQLQLTSPVPSIIVDSMNTEADVYARAAVHRALGEPHRLMIVEALGLSDRSPSDLQTVTGLSSNLLAFHLDVLEQAGVIDRNQSAGDGRRRYLSLRVPIWSSAPQFVRPVGGPVLFVCTHNSARSQLAAGLWRRWTGRQAMSAGTTPAERVHPLAVEVAGTHGLDLAGERPRAYADIDIAPDLVVSVCDRAHEAGLPWQVEQLHWSVPDPAAGARPAFERAYVDIDKRVQQLAVATGAAA